MASQQYHFSLTTDHLEFYLEDRAIEHDTSQLWNTTNTAQDLVVIDELIAIRMNRWGENTTITAECRDHAPEDDEARAVVP